MEFLEILEWVKEAITPYFDKVTLLDAHSFVWMMWMLDKPQGSPEWFYDKAQTPDATQFNESIEKLREQFIERFSPKKLSDMNGKELLDNVFSNRPTSTMHLLMNDKTYRSFGAAGHYKYLQVVYQGLDGEWYYKESTHPDKLTVQEAEQKAEWVRDQLLYCVDQIEKIGVFQSIKDYERLQNNTEDSRIIQKGFSSSSSRGCSSIIKCYIRNISRVCMLIKHSIVLCILSDCQTTDIIIDC